MPGMTCRLGTRSSYTASCGILAFVLALPSTGLSKSKEFLKPLPTPPDNSTPAPLPLAGFDPHFDISAIKAGTPAPKLDDFWLFDIQRALAAQQYDKAIDACNAALASPTSYLGTATTLSYRAEAYAAEKKWSHALSDVSEAIKDKPQWPFLFVERGHCYTP
jgi:tetratricopeptide (TPR) repeat protein